MIAGRVLQLTQSSNSTITLHLQPAQPIRFLAGQYIDVFLPHERADNRGEHRWFSIASPPNEPFISITTRLYAPGSTYKRVLQRLRPGDQVQLGEVLGDFVVPKDRHVPLMLLGAGTGLAPFASMVSDLAQRVDSRQVVLWSWLRAADSQLFASALQAPFVQRHERYYGPPAVAFPRIDASEVLASCPDIQRAQWYLAGSEHFVLDGQSALEQGGVSSQRISLDYFTGYNEA